MIVNKSPSSINGNLTVLSDETYIYFIDNNLTSIDNAINFNLENKANVKMVFVDMSVNDINLEITANLSLFTRCEIYLASINSTTNNKTFKVSTIHSQGESYSRTKMAGINASSGKLKFLGSSFIIEKAHNSDTRQEGKITNLSPLSQSEVSPALFIKDNAVKASHGATVGAYNPDHIFYLMSRGLSFEESKKLITVSSLLPILEELKDEKLIKQAKEYLEGLDL